MHAVCPYRHSCQWAEGCDITHAPEHCAVYNQKEDMKQYKSAKTMYYWDHEKEFQHERSARS